MKQIIIFHSGTTHSLFYEGSLTMLKGKITYWTCSILVGGNIMFWREHWIHRRPNLNPCLHTN